MTAAQARARVGGAIAVYVGAIVLFLVTRDRGRVINTVSVLLVAAAVLLVTQSVRRWMPDDARRHDRHVIVGALIVIGAGLLAWWQLGNRPDGVGFAGIASLYLAFGLIVAEGRRASWNGVAGVAVLVGCAIAIGVGLAGLGLGGASLWAGVSLGGGLLVVPVGLNLVSAGLNAEDAATTPGPRVWWLAAGILCFVGSLIVLAALGIPVRWLLVIGGAALALMIAIAMPASLDVVIVVGVVAAIALTSQQEVPTPSAIARRDGVPAFAALGDSFISGEGAREFLQGTNASGHNECRRSPKAYAPLLAEHSPPGIPHQVVFVACSGAKAIDIAGTNQYPEEPTYDVTMPTGRRAVLGQLAILEAVEKTTPITFVLLSIGGNDSLFGTIAQTCMLPGDCSRVGQAWLDHLQVVERRLDHTYALLARHLHGIPVLVMPYPVPLADHTCDYSLFSEHESEFLFHFTQELNRVVHRASDRAGFRYVDTVPSALDDHRICDGPRNDISVNFLKFNGVTGPFEDRINPKNWLHNNLHPNETGHALIRDALVTWLHLHPLDRPPAETADLEGTVPDVTDVVADQMSAVCVGSNDLEGCSSDWGLEQTIGLVFTRGWIVLAAFGGAWLLALFVVGAVRKKRAAI